MSIHERLALEMSRCLEEANIPDWMTKGKKTTLIQKTLQKRNAPNNYRPITYLPMMRKMLAPQIRQDSYYLLLSHKLFSEEQKGWHKRTRRTGDLLLYIDQHILKGGKTRRKNLAMTWIDNDIVPQSWMMNCLKMLRYPTKLLSSSRKLWRNGK